MTETDVYDGQIHHPFRCLVAGPSQSGKSTFVCSLLMHQDDIIDVTFDYVIIVLGTDVDKNEILGSLPQQIPNGVVQVIKLKKKYRTNDEMKRDFLWDLEKHLGALSQGGKKGCIIFDDLMSELSECGLLVDLFTKFSSHYSLTIIHITQNVFFKSAGKHGTNNVTIFRNTQVLVLFQTPMDTSMLMTITK